MNSKLSTTYMNKIDYCAPGCRIVSASVRRLICVSIYGVGTQGHTKGLDSYGGVSLDEPEN